MCRYVILALLLCVLGACGGENASDGIDQQLESGQSPFVAPTASPESEPTPTPTPTPTLIPTATPSSEPEKAQVFIIGDSTVANYGTRFYPQMGWGQVLHYYFDEQTVQVENRARGGRSSRSFYNEEGLWDTVRGEIGSGDYVLIQFGHNDRDSSKPERYTSTEDFEVYLTKYVNEIRAKNAVPILVSPMVMNAYQGDVLRNVFTESGNNYRGAMVNVATQLDVAFVDLNEKSFNLVSALGREQASHYLYLILDPGEYSNYPEGKGDGTHFQEFGAVEMSRLVVEGLEALSDRQKLQPLLANTKHRYSLTVELLGAKGGILTKNNRYPKDIPLTLKTIPADGEQFDAWYRLGKIIGENKLLQIPMPANNITITAAFNSEVPVFSGDVATVFLIGDSTVADYTESYYPQKGWGQVLQPFFDSAKIKIDNRALGGRSSKSFYNDHWDDVKASITAGDFVLIQFGINDRSSDPDRSAPTGGEFEGYLTSFVKETREQGATPVLVTTVRRNQWKDNVPYDAYHEHPVVTRELAAQLDVALIDLNAKNKALLEFVGESYANQFYYMGFAANEYPNYINGKSDTVHFQEAGAVEMARLVAGSVEELNGNDDIRPLADALTPKNAMDITSPTTSAGIFTKGFTYPEGVPLTIKALPNSGSVFTQWLDENNSQISDKAIYQFIFGNSNVAYKAVFNNSEGLGIPKSNLSAELDGTDVVLNWNLQNYDPVVTYLEIYRNDKDTFSDSTLIADNVKTTGSYVDTAVDSGKTYWYMFRITQGSKVTENNPEISIRVPYVDEIPVTNLTAKVDGTAVELMWDLKYFEPEITYLEVYRNDKNEHSGRTRIVPGAALSGSFRDTGLQPGTTYWYMFKVKQAGVFHNTVPEAETKIPEDAVSNDPEPREPGVTNLTTTVNGTTVTVSWNLQNFSSNITSLELYRNDKNALTDRVRVVKGAKLSGEFVDKGVESGKTYWYMFKMKQNGVLYNTDPEAETVIP